MVNFNDIQDKQSKNEWISFYKEKPKSSRNLINNDKSYYFFGAKEKV